MIKQYKNGIELEGYIKDMPEEIYHNTSGFISKSTLSQLEKQTPYRFLKSVRKPQTKAMEIGTAIHCAILEPLKFQSDYLLLPDVHAKTLKAYKEAVANNPDKKVINGTDAKNINGMIKALNSNSRARYLLSLDGHCELSGFHADTDSGVKLRHRFDKLTHCGIGIDLKKTQSVAPEDLSKTINDYGYHMQCALYSDAYQAITGMPLKAFYFIFVEESYPHEVAVTYLDDVSEHIGRENYKALIGKYQDVVENRDEYLGSSDELMVSLPEWVIARYERDLEDGGIY